MKIIEKIYKLVFSRATFFMIALLFQIFILLVVFYWFYEYRTYFYWIMLILSLITIIFILNKGDCPEYKISWIIPIVILPAAGILLYAFFNIQYKSRTIAKNISENDDSIKKVLKQSDDVLGEIKNKDIHVLNLIKYMNNCTPYIIYKNTKTTFFKSGEEKFDSLIKDLKEAKEFIFLEYFIIARGYLWGTIFKILKEKVKEGVEVRIMYDGMCENQALPHGYSKILKKYNIKVKIINPMLPTLSTYQNNRDHRKIAVIDGKIAYTGGINIGDEYINKKLRYGYWKDTAIRIEGEAVNSFTLIFLTMWNVYDKNTYEYQKYLRDYKVESCSGYVMPYADSPFDINQVSKRIYLDIINTATRYIHIMTPYLIIDSELISALKYASKRGIDVKILMPNIPDKKYAFYLSQSYYKELLNTGIRIYQYTPGFIHAKEVISDDLEAVIGTVNFDYRSLFLHFECATYLYKTNTVEEMENDYLNALDKSQEITLQIYNKMPLIKRIYGQILRLFAPLM